MAFLDDLAAGKLGLRVRTPEHLSISRQGEAVAELYDAEHDVDWWFFFFPDLHLDLSPQHAPQLHRDIHRHARGLFDTMFGLQKSQAEGLQEAPPRIADPEWTPVVEIEQLQIDGGDALSVLHRMEYWPGAESILGHTLIPVEDGLFEARWLARAQTTGLRETLLRATLQTETDADDEPISMAQEYIDDPAHDAMIPGHPLSIARAAKRWHERAEVRVEKRPAAPPRGELSLPSASCSISAPPRFAPGETLGDGDDVFCMLGRVSFCGTDGVDRLVVARTATRIRGLLVSRRLAKLARDRSQSLFEQLGYEDVQCEVRPAELAESAVEVVTEGEPEGGGGVRGRMLWRWFLDDTGRVWSIAFRTTVVVPLEEVSAEVTAVARSWKRLGRE